MAKCSLSEEGLTLPESRSKCCFFFPFKCGVFVIAFLIILVGVQASLYLVEYFKSNSEVTISVLGWILCVIPLLYAVPLVVNFLLKDDRS